MDSMQTPELDMIKQTLMRVIDDMNKMESQRLLPDGHPKKMGDMPPAPSPDAPAIAADEPDGDEGSSDLDPNVLGQLLDKAGDAGPDGSTDEDAQSALDPDIAAIVAEKKKKPAV